MKISSIVLQQTNSTPEISFLKKGELKIIGRSIPEDVHKFYNPLIDWAKKLDAKKVKLDLKLEYLNTSSTKKILSLLVAIDENEKIKKIDVNWYYESDDMEMEELGSIYEVELKKAKFNYIGGIDIF